SRLKPLPRETDIRFGVVPFAYHNEPWPPSAMHADTITNHRSVNRFLTGAGYAPRMPPALPRFAAAAMLLFACGAVDAATVRSVEILGLDDAMTENVRVSLSLVDAIGKDVRGRRLGYLVREADDETREALEPFGYYSPEITVERNRTDDGTDVVITVKPGEPVRV